MSNHLIPDFPVTHTNNVNARTIFGLDLANAQGKIVRWAPAPVVADYVAVPQTLVFFVNNTSFLITMLRRIKFVTAEHVPVQTAKSLAKHLDPVVHVYAQASFIVRTVLMDGEFKKIKVSCPNLNATRLRLKSM